MTALVPVGRTAVARIASAAAIARAHPRHVVLLGVVAGLLAGAHAPSAALLLAAVAATVAGRVPTGIVVAAAVLASALVGDARMGALGPGRLAESSGAAIHAEAVLLEPIRTRVTGAAVARARIVGAVPSTGGGAARLADGVRGELAVLRAPDGRIPAGADVGSIVRVRGRVADLGLADAYQRRRGAHAAVIVSDWSAGHGGREGLPGALDAVRRRGSHALAAGLASREAALVRGMVLGEDEAIAPDTKTAFERSGLAHLLAVSGQNVLLLCTLVLAIGAGVGLPLRGRLILAAALVALYVPLAGGGPSIQRAGVMGIAGLVAALAGRPASRWYALGLAAAVTLALNPAAVAEPGWQLSFAAVIGLLALAPKLRDGMTRLGLPRLLAEIVAVTTAATLATAPLLAFHFREVSVVSLAANVIAAPAVPPVMWLGMLSLVVGQFAPALAVPINALNAPLLAYVDWVASTSASLPIAAAPVSLGGPWTLAAVYAGGAVAIVVAARFSRRVLGPSAARVSAFNRGRAAAVGVLVTAAVAAAVVVLAGARSSGPAPPAPGELVVSFLDVGQGDATLLQLDGAAVLVDTGPPGGPVLARLDETGVERLDALVITHAQADHEGMAIPVLERYRPRLVLNGGAGWSSRVQEALGPAMRAVAAHELAAHAGQALGLGRLRLRVLWPPAPPSGWRPNGDANLRAIVAQVSVGDFDLLLPADAESDVTQRLRLPRVEALKVAHHGSVDAGLPSLLARLQPQFAAIEVGEHNTYGHPAPSTLAALRDVPRVVRTDRDGTVRLRVRNGEMVMESA
jgi:competence protein ComEC